MLEPAKKRFEVVVLHDPWSEVGFRCPVQPSNPIWSTLRRLFKSWNVSWCAAALTVLLHGMLIGGTWMSSVVSSEVSMVDSNRLTLTQRGSASVMSMLMFVPQTLPAQNGLVISSEKLLKEIDDPIVIKTDASAVPPDIKIGNADVQDRSLAPHEDVSVSEPKMIYVSQIKARIERVWWDSSNAQRSVGACRVTILQTEQGNVQKVEFQRCIGTPAWKEGLKRAILQASPLPRPSEEGLFGAALMFDFWCCNE